MRRDLAAATAATGALILWGVMLLNATPSDHAAAVHPTPAATSWEA